MIKEDLLHSGHFIVSNTISARDWINIDALFALDEDVFINRITEVIKHTITSKILENDVAKPCFLIGVDMLGGLLAAYTGYRYGFPFTYYSERERSKFHDRHELVINKITVDKLVLLVDVIVFGTTLHSVISELLSKGIVTEETEIYVISLFERTPKSIGISEIYTNSFIRKTFIMNDYFEIELCTKKKEDCVFRKENINKYVNQRRS